MSRRPRLGPEVHPSAQTGFARSSAAYARGRPGYPPELNAWITEGLGPGAGQTLIDLGAGTGKFTRHLESIGARIIAIDPVAPMLDALRTSMPSVEALVGDADHMPLDDACADAVFCAQAFHWFATPSALAEIGRVLKPGGLLGLVWNVRDETVDWVATLTRIMAPYEQGTPRFHASLWRTLFPSPDFSELEESTFPHMHEGPFERVVVDRVLSVSFIAALPAPEREKIARRIRRMARGYPQLAAGGDVRFPYRTLAAWARKL